MGDFKVHQVRFFSPKVLGIQCFSYNELNKKLALSRTDGSIEILGNWYKEKVIPGDIDRPVETIIWVSNRLFSAGGSGEVVEYDLVKLEPKTKAHCNAGPIWCSVKNHSNTRIAVGTDGGCVVLFDVEDGCLNYLKTFSKQEGRILCLDWHQAEEIIVTGGIDNIRVWNANSGIAVERFTMKRHKQKQTIVWCIKILANLTVVSGDSQGRITFWDGKYGTELMSFFSHRADILCLAVSEDEKTVVCSGVDPKLIWFELLSEEMDGLPAKKLKGKFGAALAARGQSKWVQSFAKSFQSHDVNSLVFIEDELVSGGADSFISLISPKKKCFKYSGIPHKKLAHTASDANVLLLQYPTYLEIWELGQASGKTGDQEILTLEKHPRNQVQLKSKHDKPVVCCALTSNAKMVAYSTTTETRIYYLNLVTDRVSFLHLRQSNTRNTSAACCYLLIKWSSLVTLPNLFSLQMLEHYKSFISKTEITCINPAKGIAESIHLLEVSSDSRYVATANSSQEVNVFDTVSGEHVTSVPPQRVMPTAMAFHPLLPTLFIVYSNMQFREFDLTENNFTRWSKRIKKTWHSQWLSRRRKITSVNYNPLNPNQLILQDEEMICLLDKNQPFPNPKVHFKSFGHQGSRGEAHAFHIVNKFRYILGSSFLRNGQMVIVEKTPKDFEDDLLPVLRVKKFGMG
ncbi:LOW QUALITY PROTEIN: U3 small nucleolar RNA-associated protein 4 homolog [Octopus sinensis]|uniref:LOW QUALITY PROTEIN: U3 small nucleolar RNA-associated protein 4 homolog n=1 Tax=Octopus sinensis TaxID=2607531 RepID=A0A6P7TB89_9MOLL|nr:LOW QUALITY PROTEIN: U3 small nucleolar RNA-associated protein 4 homolog [Octopus sinensis]